VSELVFAAFEALGMAATKRDVARVAKALCATGDADVFDLFGEPDPDASFDHEACAAVAEIAVRARRGRVGRAGPVHAVRAAGLVAVPGSAG
jgi:hypothetical protein